MKPLSNKIYAKKLPIPLTPGGLIVTGQSRIDKYQAKVMFVGPDVKHVKVGNIIRYDQNSCEEYEHNGIDGVFLKETNNGHQGGVIAIL